MGQVATSQLDLIFRDRPQDPIGFRELPAAPPEAARIWAILHDRVGEDHAIHSADIERRTGLSGVAVRYWVRWLVMKAKKNIRSSSKGYFVPKDLEEATRRSWSMFRRGIKIVHRARVELGIGDEELGPQVALALKAEQEDEASVQEIEASARARTEELGEAIQLGERSDGERDLHAG